MQGFGLNLQNIYLDQPIMSCYSLSLAHSQAQPFPKIERSWVSGKNVLLKANWGSVQSYTITPIVPRRSLHISLIIGSAEALPILCVRYFWWERERERERERYREREREIDGSDVTIVALKLAMNLHFHLPKIRTIGDELTLSLPKFRTFRFSLHTSRLSLHGEVTMVGLKFAMSSHFSLPNMFSPSGFVPPLSNSTSRATSDQKPTTNDQILPSPILFFPSKNWIKLIPKTIGNRKRDCAWGGSGW